MFRADDTSIVVGITTLRYRNFFRFALRRPTLGTLCRCFGPETAIFHKIMIAEGGSLKEKRVG